jgi:RNA polymerase sigma factor (TIGR02999 family)
MDQPVEVGAVTQILQGLEDPLNNEEVLRLTYLQLRSLAQSILRRYGSDLSLGASDILNNAFVRAHGLPLQFPNTSALLAFMREKMRQVVWDHARKHKAQKRPSSGERVDMDHILMGVRSRGLAMAAEQPEAVLRLRDVLEELKATNASAHELIDLFYFDDLSQKEIAAHFGVKIDTVKHRLNFARTWIAARMQQRI